MMTNAAGIERLSGQDCSVGWSRCGGVQLIALFLWASNALLLRGCTGQPYRPCRERCSQQNCGPQKHTKLLRHAAMAKLVSCPLLLCSI
jgi:hypothetical protein